jgi:hypothetical protein
MKKIKSLPTQKGKIVLAFLIVPCIMSMACGLKVTIHQVGSEALSEGNYATIIYGQFGKWSDFQFVSIDGEMVQADEYYGSDHYRIKPGLHTLVFKKRDPQSYYHPLWTKKEKLAYDERHETYRLYKKEVSFEAVPGGKYQIIHELICVSEKKGPKKSLNFFTSHIYQTKIKEADSDKIVSNPNDGEFQPLIGQETTKILWSMEQFPILHLYDDTELPDDKIARLRVDQPLKTGIRIEAISGTSIDGTEILFRNIDFWSPSVSSQLKKLGSSRFEAFALLPGTYAIEVSYRSESPYSLKYSLTNQFLSLDAIAGSTYSIDKKISSTSRGYIIQYNIKNITGHESEK